MAQNNLVVLFLSFCYLFSSVYSVDVSNGSSISVANDTSDMEPPKIVDADHFNVSTEETSPTLSTETPARTSTIVTTTTSTTTTTQSTTTTTVKPTKAPKRPTQTSSNNRRVCSCDLHLKSCDINCCCDMDCSKKEKKVFQFCINSEFYEPQIAAHHSHNSHSCFRSQIFYRENSPYYIEEANGGMFCVVKDNVDHIDQLESEPKNVGLKFLSKKKLKFSWDFMRKMQPEISWEPYKYGSNLLQVKTTFPAIQKASPSPFGIPSSLYSKKCSATEYIKFLQPMQTRCKIRVNNLKAACTGNSQLNVNTFLKNTAFISNPIYVNITESLVPLIMGLCSSFRNGSKVCHPIPSFNEPRWDEDSSTCFNILESLELTFIHSGIEGLSKVVAKAQLGDYNSSSNQEITQEYSTNFFWRTSLIEEPTGSEEKNRTMTRVIEKERQLQDEKDVHPLDWPRSGNPGYILGKPVVMGVMISSEVEKEGHIDPTMSGKEKEEANSEDRDDSDEAGPSLPTDSKATVKPPEKLGISLDRNPNGWMTVHSPGVCHGENNQRLNVLFGMGQQSECTLNFSNYETCDDFQKHIAKIILGISPESESVERYVAAFGNPDWDDMNDWLPVDIPPNLGKGASANTFHECDAIVSTMKIKIAYAYVGPVNFPQAKIIGVLFEFGESFSIPKNLRCLPDETDCILYQHQVKVVTTVMFIDSTKAPKPKIGQWPVVSIKLPQDFFYPFATTSSSPQQESVTKIFLFLPIILFFV